MFLIELPVTVLYSSGLLLCLGCKNTNYNKKGF